MLDIDPCKNCKAPKRLQQVNIFQTADPYPHAMTSARVVCLNCGYTYIRGDEDE